VLGARPAPDRLRPEDLDLLPEATALSRLSPPRGAHALLWTIAVLCVVAVLWAGFSPIEEITRAVGTVVPARQVQVVQNLEGGILAELLVREGQPVQEGQGLLRIDDTRFAVSYREARLRMLALEARAARLRAEAEGRPFEASAALVEAAPDLVERERRLLEARERELQADLDILRQQAAQRRQELLELRAREAQLARSHGLLQRELAITRPLIKQGAASEVEVLRLERRANELAGDRDAAALAAPRLEAALAEAETKGAERVLSFRNQASAELNDALAELAGLAESSLALEDRVRRTLVTSPVNGLVKRILVTTLGGVIQPGMDLMEIVPSDEQLVVEVRVRPADIAFVHPGQKAVVKLTAYDFAIYGSLPGQLDHVSADAITDDKGESHYLARVRTERSHMGQEAGMLPIIPGMIAEVDIVTGRRTVLQYLLKPLSRARERAFRER
jgi:adhesin transport system membrane fusion protein